MKRFSAAILVTLVIASPSLNAYPIIEIPEYSMYQSLSMSDPRNLSYDEVMHLLELIESDAFEERCSIGELELVNRWIAFLATEGSTEDEKANIEMSVASLFQGDYTQYAYWFDSSMQYTVQSLLLNGGSREIVLCKSWFKKQWDQTRKFAKEHKKEILIGAIIVVAVTVVVVAAVAISSTAATNAAVGGVAVAASSGDFGSSHSDLKDSSSDAQSELAKPVCEESLTSSLQAQISAFRENIAQEQLAIWGPNAIPMEENGRIIGSLFTHQTIDTLKTQAAENPFLRYELQNLGLNAQYPLPHWITSLPVSPHACADSAFSTNYTSTFLSDHMDLNTLSYQSRGDWALSAGYYAQAAQDFGKAIEIEPNDPTSYLGRGVANFELGRIEESVADYNTYVSQTKEHFSVTDFSIGFARGLPEGIYDSGEGVLLFVTDLARHPVQTSKQVYDSLSTLSHLVKSGEWNLIGETLSPELHQLISEWDGLSAQEKGELSGYAFGKHGADILIPGATAKAVTKGSAIAKELGTVCKNLQSAEKVLILEAVAEGGAAGINVVNVIQNNKISMAEKLGFRSYELVQIEGVSNSERILSVITGDTTLSSHEIILTNHALERAIQRGVSKASILEAFSSPLKIENVKIDPFGRPSQRFIGRKAEVVINPETNKIVSVNPTSTKKYEKLINEIENGKNKSE